MAAATGQQLILDAFELLKTRSLKDAGVDSNKIPKIFYKGAGLAAGTVPASKTWLIIELDGTAMTTLDEKGHGSDHPRVPIVGRP